MKVLYTGGAGKYATEIQKLTSTLEFFFPNRQECNLLNKHSMQNYARKHKYFDIVVTGANQFPGRLEDLNFNSFEIPVNHLCLIEMLQKKPKYFIHLTTGMSDYDEHFLYRAQKTFAENLFTRYFYFERNLETRFINFHPHHVDDQEIRKKSALVFLKLLENIENYQKLEYSVDIPNLKPVNYKF